MYLPRIGTCATSRGLMQQTLLPQQSAAHQNRELLRIGAMSWLCSVSPAVLCHSGTEDPDEERAAQIRAILRCILMEGSTSLLCLFTRYIPQRCSRSAL